ncbi:MAG: adenylate/guanylate cyclase domain-containing protein [Acidimicrobiales bacterium]
MEYAPGATVTFLMTDVEGSTPLWETHEDSMLELMAWHHGTFAEVATEHEGVIPADQGEGDARFGAFAEAPRALECALELQRRFLQHVGVPTRSGGPQGLSVRMGLHTGAAVFRNGNYFGEPVNRCARVRGLAYGGQILISETTRDLVARSLPSGASLREVGTFRLKGLSRPERVFRLCHPDLPDDLPPPSMPSDRRPTQAGAATVPTGEITLLFTGIDGAARLWEADPTEMSTAVARHDEIVQAAIRAAGGYVFRAAGDGYGASFPQASAALQAALSSQQALALEPWSAATPLSVAMALHTGVCDERDGDYFGPVVNRAAGLQATASGGQTVVSLATAELLGDRLPDGVWLLDLGEHRLKDLDRPIQVFQACVPGAENDFPPLRSLSSAAHPNNLPAQVSSFVGRDEELAEVKQLVAGGRLVTLTGPGGAGKTRLGLQVAAEMLEGSPDGAWLVELAPLAGDEIVASTVANVLRVRDEPHRPVLDSLVEAIGDRSLVLLLDNCEHVIDGAAGVANAVLRACANVRLLATSREPLSIDGEVVYRVPPLSLPAPEDEAASDVMASESGRLFADRAAQHRHGFVVDDASAAVVARICRRLDGLPLAIELATARLRALSLDELDARLDERFRLLTGGSRTALPRQQTLRALIDWSWELLSAGEREVLAKLSVFAGGFDLEAAEGVAAGDLVSVDEVVDHVGTLVDKSLVEADDSGGTIRYRLLESVLAYAGEHLSDGGAAEESRLRGAHRDHFLALAEAAVPKLGGADQESWLQRLETEHDNLRAALAYSLEDDDPLPGLRLATALARFWARHGHFSEGLMYLGAALDRPEAQGPTIERGFALGMMAALLDDVGDYRAGRARAKAALEIGRAQGDDRLCALALVNLGGMTVRLGDPQAALLVLEEGLSCARRCGDDALLASILGAFAAVETHLEDYAAAVVHFEESVDIYRRAGNRASTAADLGNLGYLELNLGRIDAARVHLTDAVAVSRDLSDWFNFAYGAFNLGLVHYVAGDRRHAGDLFSEAVTVARDRGIKPVAIDGLVALAATVHAGDPATAARLYGAAEAARQRSGEPVAAMEASMRDGTVERLRSELGDDTFELLAQEGRQLSLEEAVTVALGARPLTAAASYRDGRGRP